MTGTPFKIPFFVLLTFNVVALILATWRIITTGKSRHFLRKAGLVRPSTPVRPFQADAIAEFRQMPAGENEIVFAGDSITAEIPWAEFFTPIRNRGIGADASDGLLRRFDDILKSGPRQIFINIGTNDLNFDYKPSFVVENVEAIFEKTRRTSPRTEVFLISVLPINISLASSDPESNRSFILRKASLLSQLNWQLQDLALRHEVSFIDLWPIFADAAGQLHAELTVDGTHLNIQGKIRYVEALRPYVHLSEPRDFQATLAKVAH